MRTDKTILKSAANQDKTVVTYCDSSDEERSAGTSWMCEELISLSQASTPKEKSQK